LQIEVNGWKRGFRSISFIGLIRTAGVRKLGLAEAKKLVDEMLLGRSFTMEFEGRADASRFVRAADELGAVTSWPAEHEHS